MIARLTNSLLVLALTTLTGVGAVEISSQGLLDHFDPDSGLETNGKGQVTRWLNQADPDRSVKDLSTSTSVVAGPKGKMIRFDSPADSGHLAYQPPGNGILSKGYTIFTVVDLDPSENAFSRIHSNSSDTHSIFFHRKTGDMEVKIDQGGKARARRGYVSFFGPLINPRIGIITVRLTPESQELYFDGVLVDTAEAKIDSYNSGGAAFRIGNSVVGRIGHVLTYDSSATPDQLNKTGAALAEHYGLSWGGLAEAPAPPAPPIVPAEPPLRPIIGHRGNSSVAPENTLASIRAAAGLAQMTEFDVLESADGILVVIHDGKFERTTNGKGLVSSMKYAGGIDQLDAGSWFDPKFAGERLPTLDQSVTTAIELGLIPVIERKGGSAKHYYEVLSALGVLDKVHIIAFDWLFLADFRKLSPTASLGALGSGKLTNLKIGEIYASGANYIDWNHDVVDTAFLDKARAANLQVVVYTVNEVSRMLELLNLGVTTITTDKPAALDAALQAYADWSEAPAQALAKSERGFNSDPDGDLLANGIEIVLGTNPSLPDPPIIARDELSHSCSNHPSKDVAYRYFWSTDQLEWHPNGATSNEGLCVILRPSIRVNRSAPEIDDIDIHAFAMSGAETSVFVRLQSQLPSGETAETLIGQTKATQVR